MQVGTGNRSTETRENMTNCDELMKYKGKRTGIDRMTDGEVE